ncbi:MAG TPA: (2Fe-2S)-binding protein [Candidatus Binatia bacterium]|nr:(2Fe-2S)-binding protein [Candidatus Binatia bacterium]
MISVKINGEQHELDVATEMPLLWAIRDVVGLTGTKFGCGAAQCGCCTVHLEGDAVRACTTSCGSVHGKSVTTIDAAGEHGEHKAIVARLQQAWIAEQVPQCGYCQSGQIMQAAALLAKYPKPTDEQITTVMTGNICRCGAYQAIHTAIKRAAGASS